MPRIALSFVVLFSFALSLPAQPTPAQQSATIPIATNDPQAVSIINQALAVGGGAQAVSAIRDYTGSGTITYRQDVDTEIQGTVTLKGRGAAQFRMDANLPAGVRSWIVDQGHASANGTQQPHVAPKPIPSSDAFPVHAPIFPGGLAFPYVELATALNSSHFVLAYKGLVQMNGRSLHDIQLQRTMPGNTVTRPSKSAYDTKDYFIDSFTFQVVMTQEMVPKFAIRQTEYSNYVPVNGILIPFSINQRIAGQQSWSIQLSQVIFNTGLHASDFVQ